MCSHASSTNVIIGSFALNFSHTEFIRSKEETNFPTKINFLILIADVINVRVIIASQMVLPQKRRKFKSSIRGGSRTTATSKMERFVIIVNGFQSLTIITKHSILDVAAALDPPLIKGLSKNKNNLVLKQTGFFYSDDVIRQQVPT